MATPEWAFFDYSIATFVQDLWGREFDNHFTHLVFWILHELGMIEP